MKRLACLVHPFGVEEQTVVSARKICSIFAVASLLAGQDLPPIVTFKAESRIVALHATAIDGAGKLALDLDEHDFEVYENGVRQKLLSFRREDVPISLGLVIDASASMGDKRDQVAAAALELVEASNREDEVFIINFDEAPSLDADFTSDRAVMKKGLAKYRLRGGTAVRDAVREAVEHLRPRTTKEKKVIVAVTDGDDNASVESLDRLIRAAQSSEVLVYAIGLLKGEQPALADRARRALDALTRATGGQAYYLNSPEEIHLVAPQIAKELRNQYVLTYSPGDSQPDGQFRQIRVVAKRPGITVRTRTGYYAPTS